MRKGLLVDDTDDEFGCLGDPSFREEERSGRDDSGASCVPVFVDVDLGRVFTMLFSRTLLRWQTIFSCACSTAGFSCAAAAISV